MNYKGDDAKSMNSPEMNDGMLYDAMVVLERFRKGLACIHAENVEIIWSMRKKLLDEGRSDPKAWCDSRPDFTEAEYIRRAIFLAVVSKCPIYIVHLSTKRGLEEVRCFGQGSPKVFVETCPHYLTHTRELVTDNLLKVNPPIRSKEDIDALWKGINEGSIHTVGSDHISRKKESKKGSIWEASLGFAGTGTLFPVLLSEGFHKRKIPLEKIAEITSYNVAKIFRLYPRKGDIRVGSDADLTIVDLDKEKKVRHDSLDSSSDFSIYENWILKGWPVLTMVRGNVVMDNGKVLAGEGGGKFLRRNVF
jgi:dihydropyrimidinase